MPGGSNYVEAGVLNHFFRNEPVPAPTTHYVALYINDPTDADTGTEVSGGSYSRKQVTFGAPVKSGDKTVISNNAKVEFDIATTDWGLVSHWAVRTAATGGNLLTSSTFSRVENIQSGNRFTIEIGTLQISQE